MGLHIRAKGNMKDVWPGRENEISVAWDALTAVTSCLLTTEALVPSTIRSPGITLEEQRLHRHLMKLAGSRLQRSLQAT